MELLEDQGKSKKKEAQQKKITRKSNHFMTLCSAR